MDTPEEFSCFCKAELSKYYNLVDPVSFLTFLLLPTTTREALKGKNILKGQVCCDCRWKGQRHRQTVEIVH